LAVNGLQPRHAGTQHDDPRRLERAGRRHHHGKEAAVLVGRQQYGLVAA